MNLYNKIKAAYKLLQNADNLDKKIILTNYINILINSTNNLVENKKGKISERPLYTEKILEKIFFTTTK